MNTQAAAPFIEGYRSTFESMVVQAIVEEFTFPCQVVRPDLRRGFAAAPP